LRARARAASSFACAIPASVREGRIAWHEDGTRHQAQLADTVSVHLQTGGDWQNPIAQCDIGFTDGRVLHVSDATASGLPDQVSRVVYRDFLRDLHGRLESDRVSFTAGYSQARYRVVLIASILLGLILVATPLVLLMITGETRALLLLFVGAMLALPLARMVKANAPRPYTPDTPPEELGAADTASALLLHLELDWRSASRLILGIKSPPLRQKPRRAQGCRTA
jgi:hypothetical protein